MTAELEMDIIVASGRKAVLCPEILSAGRSRSLLCCQFLKLGIVQRMT
jgi:hypothetical protein